MGFSQAKLLLHLTKVSLKKYERYHEMVENYLEGEAENISMIFESMEEETEKRSSFIPRKFKDAVDDLSEELNEISVIFMGHFRNSLLVQITSFIEFELKKICNNHSEFSNSKYKISDLAGMSDLEKCKKYLVKSCNVDFNYLNGEWEFIKTAYKVRNKVIHHSGTVTKKETEDDLVKLIEQRFIIIIKGKDGEESTLRLTKRLNSKLIDVAISFFTKLLSEELGISWHK